MGSFVTEVISWVTDVWSFITSDPLILVFVLGIPLIGIGVGFLQRIFKLSR